MALIRCSGNIQVDKGIQASINCRNMLFMQRKHGCLTRIDFMRQQASLQLFDEFDRVWISVGTRYWYHGYLEFTVAFSIMSNYSIYNQPKRITYMMYWIICMWISLGWLIMTFCGEIYLPAIKLQLGVCLLVKQQDYEKHGR